jgi:chaperonin GroEL (HSP60 family)
MQLLIRISAQVVIKVGDGSTSSIVAANSILNMLKEDDDLKKVRPKELMDMLNSCVDVLSDKILSSSIKINKDNDPDFEEIYKLAMISTNGDENVSKIIQEIYKVTANPSIEFVQSKTNKTYYEIVEGYKANITYLDTIFANNDDGNCVIEKPLILMFDHKIDVEGNLPIIQSVVQRSFEENRRLVVVAPNFDRYLLDNIRTSINMEFKARGTSQIVYTRVSLINNLMQEYFNDFAVMTGGTIIRESNLKDLQEGTLNINDFIGEVENMTIGDKTTLIRGFIARRDDMYKIVMNDALAKYKKVEENHREMGIVNSELYDLKQRVSKLKGCMGIIYVGGNSSLEKLSNFDLVEDAVKA